MQPTLLMLPGNMCDDALWRDCIPGANAWPIEMPVPEGRTIKEMAAWCLNRYSGTLVPVGFSMGGIIAMECAAQAPDRIKALALLDTNPGADNPLKAPARYQQQQKVRGVGIERTVVDDLLPHYLAAKNSGNKVLIATIINMAERIGVEAFVNQSEALRTRHDLWSVVRSFTKPALVMCGDQDALCSPDLHKDIAKTLQNSTLHIVPDAGHMLPLEAPAAVRTHLAAWLKTL